LIGLLAVGGCTVESSPPPHEVIQNQRKQADAVEGLRKKQMQELEPAETPAQEPDSGETP
jgi:hypothetical protein